MKTSYLDELPAVVNEFGVPLREDEKVVFTAELSVFGDEKDQMIGLRGSKFTLTNQRIIADNGPGVWEIDILEDVVSWVKIKKRFLLFSHSIYFLVALKEEMVVEYGKRTLIGFHFYFSKEKTLELEEIVNHLQD